MMQLYYKCPICGARTTNLRVHVYKKHNMKAGEFKKKYGDWEEYLISGITEIEELKKTVSDLTKVIQDISLELGRIREKIKELEEKITVKVEISSSIPAVGESTAEALKKKLEETELLCKNMAKFIYEGIETLESVGARLEYKRVDRNGEKLIVFDIRVAARGLDTNLNKWKVFSFDKDANIYVSEFDAEWTKTFEDVKDQILSTMKQTSWRPEHLRGLKRFVRKIQKAAKEIGLNLVFEGGEKSGKGMA